MDNFTKGLLLVLAGVILGIFIHAGVAWDWDGDEVLPPPPATDTDTVSFVEWDEDAAQWTPQRGGVGLGLGDLILPDFVSYEDRLEERVSQLERDVERLRELVATQSDLIVKLGLDLSRLRHLDLYTPDPIGVDD